MSRIVPISHTELSILAFSLLSILLVRGDNCVVDYDGSCTRSIDLVPCSELLVR